jgi:methylated-DNA-[protein]-cysteine S-methyltransferase
VNVTAFQAKVYQALCEVPKGAVTTYGELAKRIGCRSAQAVGGALRNNPFAPEVPCHRVVAADLSIGGFQGETDGPQIERKRALLRAEGIVFDGAGKVKDSSVVWRFKQKR